MGVRVVVSVLGGFVMIIVAIFLSIIFLQNEKEIKPDLQRSVTIYGVDKEDVKIENNKVIIELEKESLVFDILKDKIIIINFTQE
jgi:hypothetical protein